jgi:hypothetical protein
MMNLSGSREMLINAWHPYAQIRRVLQWLSGQLSRITRGLS